MIDTDISQDTVAVRDLLLAVPHGSRITKLEISAAFGRNIDRCAHVLYSAIDIVQRDHNAVFKGSRDENGVYGYTRLTAADLPALGQTGMKRVRSAARRTRKALSAGMAGINDLPNDVRLRVLSQQSVLSLVEFMSHDRRAPKMQEAAVAPLPIAETTKLLLAAIGAA